MSSPTLNHILDSGQPYLHTVDHYPPRIRHKLPRSNAKMIQKLHDKRVDEEPKATTKGRLIETYLARKKSDKLYPRHWADKHEPSLGIETYL